MILVHLTQEILKNKNKNQKTQHDESQQLAGKMIPADTESTQEGGQLGKVLFWLLGHEKTLAHEKTCL